MRAAQFDPEFFPTPASVAYKMLEKLSSDAKHFLEPSAGKGDLAEAIKRTFRYPTIDCIEQSPELTSVLTGKGFTVVGYDFLDYAGVCYYDAIVMNPPFSNGADHLLRAWDFMHHGEIVCLLNEETIKNPHTAARQRLAELIAKHGDVEYLGDCFRKSDRKTGVNVAIVYLKKVSADDSIDLWAATSQERDVNDKIDTAENMLAIQDRLGNMQHYYDQANEHMLKAFQHLRKASLYMKANECSSDYDNIVSIALNNINSARAEFGRKHRRDAWMNVFTKMEFRKWLDKKQTEEFLRDIERNGNVPFTKENIKGTLQNVFEQRGILFEKSVGNVFDELTRYYDGNTNHTEGWKTNDSYKVNQKLIFPYGCTFEAKYGRYFTLSYSGSIDVYRDLDRILCVLDGKDFDQCLTVEKAMRKKFELVGRDVVSPFDSECQSDYFHIKFFMKGTVHLTFRSRELWARFNVTAAKGKMWIGHDTRKAGAA